MLEKAKQIRLLVLDVDGTLTSGAIFYGSQGNELRAFHIHDGMGIQLLHKVGMQIAIISGKKSESVERRIQDLNIKHAYLGYDDKLPAYEELKQKLQLTDDNIAYMGDDLIDLPILRRVHLAITVPHAPDIVKQHADLITKNKAGKGAVREVCDMLLKAQGQYESVIQSYLI